MPEPGLGELVSTTLRNRRGSLADNFSKNSALLTRLEKKGKNQMWDGGRTLVEEIAYAANDTTIRFSGYEKLNIEPSDFITSAEYSPKQAAVAVTVSGREELQNRGKHASIELVKSRIENAQRSIYDMLAQDCYSDGTADGGRQIVGLQAMISENGEGTIGGLNSADEAWWANQFSDATIDATNITSAMNGLYLKLVRRNQSPDLIVADNTAYEAYLASLQTIQRVTDNDTAQRGFQTLKYMGSDVVLDGGFGDLIAAEHSAAGRMYFLNCEYLHFRTATSRNFAVVGPDRFSTNQDAMVKFIMWAGALTCSNRSLQGVLF